MKTRIVTAALLIGLFLAAIDTNFTIVWRLFFFSFFTVVLANVWTILSIRGISARASAAPRRLQVGDNFTEDFTISNHSRWPGLLLKAAPASDLPGYQAATDFNLGPGKSFNWRSQGICRRRGLYLLGRLTITAADPFSLFSRRRTVGEPQQVLICPATVDLPFFELTRRYANRPAISWLSQQVGSNVAGIREYAAGDSLKHIHCGSTAHVGKLLVKVFEPDYARSVSKNVWIALDMERTAYPGDAGATEDYCSTAAASLLKKCLDVNCPVGLVAAAERPYLVPPEVGSQHLWQILTSLALLSAAGNTSIEQVVAGAARHLTPDSALIIITPQPNHRLAGVLRQVRDRLGLVGTVLGDSAPLHDHGSLADQARDLAALGIQVYHVRTGSDLATALDGRHVVTASYSG